MTTVREISQRLDQEALVSLYTLDLSTLDGPIMRFTDAKNGELTFGGDVYQPTDIELSGLEINTADSTSYPAVKIIHVDTPAASYLDLYDDFIGARFFRLRTYARFLDDGVEPDPTQCFPPDKFYVERLTHLDGVSVEFELRSVLNMSSRFLPRRLVLSAFCDFIYRRPVQDPDTLAWSFVQGTCPWAGASGDGGGPYYDRNGDEVGELQHDQCSKFLGTGCKTRFGANAILPYRGFPAIKRVR